MATIRQYFDTDFNNSVRLHVRIPICDSDLEAVVLYDFSAYVGFLACWVPGDNRDLDFFLRLVESLKWGATALALDGKITLPAVRQYPGKLRVENSEPFNVLGQYFGDPDWISFKDMPGSKRVFIYSETTLSDHDLRRLKQEGTKLGHEVQFRDPNHARSRSRFEVPVAFICHDSRDKDAVARKIAINLQSMMCPVWYDEFALKVGDSLRESIEKGLKECRKCILILSPNFFANNGWTKKEFDSVFTRELLEKKNVILPIWHGVSEQSVFAYSPSLVNRKALIWSNDKEEDLCRSLYQAVTKVDDN